MANKDLVLQFQRIRNIKPEFFSHEGLFEAEEKTHLPVRIAFIGLWTVCDKFGRFEWRPRQLKFKILPYDQVDFSKILEALESLGSIKRYAADGKDYGYIPSWRKHQYISVRERKVKSNYPQPEGVQDESTEESAEDSEDSMVSESGQNGTGAVPKRFGGVSVGNGNGKGVENVNMGNGDGAVGTGIRNPIPAVMHSSLQDALHTQCQSQSEPESDEEDPYDVIGTGKLRQPQPLVTVAASRLAKAFYDTLPEENKSAAPKTWQTLWREDFEGLLKIADEASIADILKDYRRTNKAKYVVRAQTFVEMFEDLDKAVGKYRKAKAAGRLA